MKCYLCKSESHTSVNGTVRDVPHLEILKCQDCGLVFLENFDHIDDSFYEESKMTDSSVSVESWRKETLEDDLRRFKKFRIDIEDKNILDIGAGNGQFLRLASVIAKGVTGVEPDPRSSDILKKEGIDCISNLSGLPAGTKFDTITAFHVIEHLKDPIEFLKQISKYLKSDGKIILEVPNADDALISIYDSSPFSRFTYWGCHLMLFNELTLKRVIESAGLTCNQIIQVQRYPLSNHLFWLAQGRPGGHIAWENLNDRILNESYERVLSKLGACDTVVAEVSL